MDAFIEYPYNTPEIPLEKIKFLWISNWWDGPLSGMCECNDKGMWFEVCAETYTEKDKKKFGFWRRYLLFVLKPEEVKEEEKWHNLFRDKVGRHWDCGEDGNRLGPDYLNPQSTWHEFYEEFDKVKDEMRQYHKGKREPYAYFNR